MHEKSINATQNEVLRIIKSITTLIEEGIQSTCLLKSSQKAGQSRIFSEEEAKDALKIFIDERNKIENLETSLVVVGTMKAGKSTIINALVGEEILPNRTRAMTTIPTRLLHCFDKKIPTLYISNPTPFNDAIQKIKRKLDQAKKLQKLDLFFSEETESFLKRVNDDSVYEISTHTEGSHDILQCLKDINGSIPYLSTSLKRELRDCSA